MFHPGETIGHTFIIPFNVANLSKVIITYKQNDHIILERPLTSGFEVYVDDQGNIHPGKTKIGIVLTQQESLLFEENKDFFIQLNVYSDSNTRHASCEIKGSNGVQHYKEVI